jgi:hypothetical protein
VQVSSRFLTGCISSCLEVESPRVAGVVVVMREGAELTRFQLDLVDVSVSFFKEEDPFAVVRPVRA